MLPRSAWEYILGRSRVPCFDVRAVDAYARDAKSALVCVRHAERGNEGKMSNQFSSGSFFRKMADGKTS